MRCKLHLTIALIVPGLAPRTALAETFEVGPGKPYATIQDTLDLLKPGDVVEVQGDHTYPGDLWFREEHSGTSDAPVTVRGIRVDGKRPILEGVGSEMWHDMIVLFQVSNFVFEGFEIVGDGDTAHTGLVHKGDNVTLRDLVVHGVGSHGLLGTDSESGSLLLERSEFYDNGFELYDHQIYVATDESLYPGSVFRMQYCYVHDGAGGNNVKSRAERNEIYHNWIEGAVYHELDLIGPDGQDEDLAREDSDVVGNVLIKHSEWRIARIGGDGTGNTKGRYRFVNNTMVLGEQSDVAIGMQFTVESLELHNNVIVRLGASGGELYNHYDAEGPEPQVFGSNNWLQEGLTGVPGALTGTIVGMDPGFVDAAAWDFRPRDDSPLLEAGASDTVLDVAPFINPLALPTHVPPSRALGTEAPRPQDATPDIGAYELGSGEEPGETTTSDTGEEPTSESGEAPTSDTGETPTDSGEAPTSDSGEEPTDSGTEPTDSGAEPGPGDTDGETDGSASAGSDGATAGGEGNADGCNCDVGGSPLEPAGLLLMVGVGALARRRRR